MAWPPILVRYGEIGIKSRSVRIQFERKLVERIEEQLVRRATEAEVKRDFGRIFVRASDEEKALDAIRHTFGVVNASPAVETGATLDTVAGAVLDIARERMPPRAGFAIRVKRSGIHPFSSLDVAKACASRILDDLAEREPHVDLDAPGFELHVEVREGSSFVFSRKVVGPGGLPLGSQGRIGVLVDSPRSAHAAWLAAKRGTMPFFFSSDPDAAAQWLRPLEAWIPDRRVHVVHGKDRAEVFTQLQPLLEKHRCQAIVTADGALDAIERAPEDKLLGYPVFRPLVGYAGARFRALARAAELPEGA